MRVGLLGTYVGENALNTLAKLFFQVYVMGKGFIFLCGLLVVLPWLPFAFLVGLLLILFGAGASKMRLKRFGRFMVSVGIVLLMCFSFGQSWLHWGHDPPARVAALIQQVRGGHMPPTTGTALFVSTPPTPAGHQYLALNRTSCRSSAFSYARLQQDMDSDFSFNARSLTNDNSVITGKHFILGLPPFLGVSHVHLLQNEVYVAAMGHQNFTLHTVDEAGPPPTAEESWLSLILDLHIFKGTAIHGFVTDSTGAVWMFQIGKGESNEKPALQMLNYAVSDWMWAKMANNASSACR